MFTHRLSCTALIQIYARTAAIARNLTADGATTHLELVRWIPSFLVRGALLLRLAVLDKALKCAHFTGCLRATLEYIL